MTAAIYARKSTDQVGSKALAKLTYSGLMACSARSRILRAYLSRLAWRQHEPRRLEAGGHATGNPKFPIIGYDA